MHRLLLILIATAGAWLCGALPLQEPAQPGFDHEHALFTRVLAAHVHGDRVDYEALSRARADLDQYLGVLTALDAKEFSSWTRPEQFAFWINAYNAFTLQAVLVNYPLEPLDSLRDVGGAGSGSVWKRKNLRLGRLIAGHAAAEVSLDELRDLVLRPKFKDARVHAALNNSCRGAPALRASAFTAAALDRELESAARAWLADPLRTKFDESARAVEACVVFDEFRADFVREAGSIETWIARFAPAKERIWIESPGKALTRTSKAFDWKLNDIEREAK